MRWLGSRWGQGLGKQENAGGVGGRGLGQGVMETELGLGGPRACRAGGWGHVMILWERPEGGGKGCPGRGGEAWRCWSEAVETFLEIWRLAVL